VSAAGGTADAYGHCESVTRAQAANFFYGIRLLPRDRRRAMCAVYAFARRVDDIGDGTLEPEEKLRRLDREAAALAAIAPPGADAGTGASAGAGAGAEVGSGSGDGEDPVMVALADTQRRFALPGDALSELIEGVRMDVGGVTYESFEDLVVYCRRVAGAIGRASLTIFGLREGAGPTVTGAEGLADDLGVALQLTNILRDVREDAQNGRVYLPAEDLRRFGVIAGGERAQVGTLKGTPHGGGHPGGRRQAGEHAAAELLGALDRAAAGPAEGGLGDAVAPERLFELVRFESERAREWFDRGIALTGLLDRRSAACVLAMAGIYRRLLERIDAHPEEAVRRRMSLPAREKAWVAARGMLGAGA
jgi:15-cis-phytoene synthase